MFFYNIIGFLISSIHTCTNLKSGTDGSGAFCSFGASCAVQICGPRFRLTNKPRRDRDQALLQQRHAHLPARVPRQHLHCFHSPKTSMCMAYLDWSRILSLRRALDLGALTSLPAPPSGPNTVLRLVKHEPPDFVGPTSTKLFHQPPPHDSDPLTGPITLRDLSLRLPHCSIPAVPRRPLSNMPEPLAELCPLSAYAWSAMNVSLELYIYLLTTPC